MDKSNDCFFGFVVFESAGSRVGLVSFALSYIMLLEGVPACLFPPRVVPLSLPTSHVVLK